MNHAVFHRAGRSGNGMCAVVPDTTRDQTQARCLLQIVMAKCGAQHDAVIALEKLSKCLSSLGTALIQCSPYMCKTT